MAMLRAGGALAPNLNPGSPSLLTAHLGPPRQEPDTAASAAQALIGLLVANEHFFPLGFAYGHVRDAAVRERRDGPGREAGGSEAAACSLHAVFARARAFTAFTPALHACPPTHARGPPMQVSVADLAGRGFASQEILEELAARDDLSNKARHRRVEPRASPCFFGSCFGRVDAHSDGVDAASLWRAEWDGCAVLVVPWWYPSPVWK